ncbi:MAG TPA: mechanosensitive ion channel domain-containing protein [Acetobacteraceae bacterium]
MPRVLAALSLAALAAMLWWFHGVSATFQLFASPGLTRGLDVAASVTTALLAVTLAGHAIVRLVLLTIYGIEPTGFQRAGLYAILGTVAGAAVLTHLGVNVAAVFATSAILTAVFGFALQPTLNGLIGGLTLHTDRVLRIGDAILHDGNPVEVTAFNWRSVSGRKLDGSLVVFPNARIVDGTIEILPRDHPVRADTVFPVPITIVPQRLSDLVGELVADFAEVDDGQPVTVAPIAFEPDKALARYRVRYRVYAYADRSDVEAEVLRRIWYALQREGIAWPVNTFYDPEFRIPQVPSVLLAHDWPEAIAAAIARAPAQPDLLRILAHSAQEIATAGLPLFYAATERIVLPPRACGSVCLLVRGMAYEIASEFDTLSSPGQLDGNREFARDPKRLLQRAAVKHISDRLAEVIGPYAEVAVRRAAGEVAGCAEICVKVADEIEDPVLRRAFLAETSMPEERRHGPGLLFRLRRDAAGNFVPDPLLRAAEACALVAIPPGTLAADAA